MNSLYKVVEQKLTNALLENPKFKQLPESDQKKIVEGELDNFSSFLLEAYIQDRNHKMTHSHESGCCGGSCGSEKSSDTECSGNCEDCDCSEK